MEVPFPIHEVYLHSSLSASLTVPSGIIFINLLEIEVLAICDETLFLKRAGMLSEGQLITYIPISLA